jgi:hypothetical protein
MKKVNDIIKIIVFLTIDFTVMSILSRIAMEKYKKAVTNMYLFNNSSIRKLKC